MLYSKISLSKLCSADGITFDEQGKKQYTKNGKILNIYK